MLVLAKPYCGFNRIIYCKCTGYSVPGTSSIRAPRSVRCGTRVRQSAAAHTIEYVTYARPQVHMALMHMYVQLFSGNLNTGPEFNIGNPEYLVDG